MAKNFKENLGVNNIKVTSLDTGVNITALIKDNFLLHAFDDSVKVFY